MPPRLSAWRLAVGVSVALTEPSFGPLGTGGVVAQRGYGDLGASSSSGGGETAMLMDEIAQLRAEVARLKSEPQVRVPQPGLGANAQAASAGGQLDMASVQRELEALKGSVSQLAGGGGGFAGGAPLGAGSLGSLGGLAGALGGGSLAGLGGLGGGGALGSGNLAGLAGLGSLQGGALGGYPTSASGGAAGVAPSSMPVSGGEPDKCMENPLFAQLFNALQKLALLEQDPVEASYQIYSAWENDPSIFDVCPVGLITALVYLSIAQERDWKYRLLHRATYLLYSTPGLAVTMAAGRWPMSDRLIRTMYHNSQVLGRSPLKFSDGAAQAVKPAGQVADPGVDEAVGLSLQHHDTVKVHFTRVLYYHFYHQEKSPCACRTRSWCLPQWTRHFTNHTVDIWLAARDERKTLFRMDRSGCFRNLNLGLATHHIAETFDLVFVFEVNALMHPQCRILPAERVLLYPTFDLNEQQMQNFEELGVSVLPDDGLLKPPNPALRRVLDEAVSSRWTRMPRLKDRLLLYPADIRPLKGQTDFLRALVAEEAKFPASIQRLKGLTIVIAGGCDGNQTYCSEVVSLTQRINSEGLLNIVIADQLKDEELSQLYAAALGVVLYSRVDCNPRAIYEGFVADSPFFAAESVRVPALAQHLGHLTDGDASRLPEQLLDFVNFCEAGGFSGRPREFARKHLVEADVYRKVLEWMDHKFVSGKKMDTVIRSEDALSGAFGGLGPLLGGSNGKLLNELGRRAGQGV